MLSIDGVSKDIFLKSQSVKILPMVSAEWNQNIFNAPYLTVAGSGNPETLTKTFGSVTAVTDANKHPNFDTYKFTMDGTDDYVKYSINTQNSAKAYKIITYVSTTANNNMMINLYAQGSGSRQFGSNNVEVNSFNWTKVEVYIGSIDSISQFSLTLAASKFSTDVGYGDILYTMPEVYETTEFDYKYGSIWSTDTPFTGFRPGESYVCTGNSNYALGTNGNAFSDDYRKINTTSLLKDYGSTFKMPVSPLASTPNFFYSSSPIPIYKHALITDISEYRYFISDSETNSSITGFYASPILVNKVVIKFNTYLSIPTVNVTITKTDNTTITGQGTPDDNGTLLLYLNGSSLTSSRWSNMPSITDAGDISNYVSIKKITVSQSSVAPRSQFSSLSNEDKTKMQIVEISPRLEIDLSPYVVDLSTNKSLDAKDTYMPISSVVTDDANITLTGIPLGDISNPIPIFSNVSNYSSTKLTGLLRKNIKFYINYNLIDYADWTTYQDVSVNKIIPGGVWYSDTWQQNDIDAVSIQCFDFSRYLQSTPAADYVSNYKNAFDVITNILDLSGFTDYDVDSLYTVCHDSKSPLNMDYYYCNSKDTTLVDALNQIFLPYQIGAYIDNFGIMRFLSLSNIMSSIQNASNFDVNASSVIQNGYSITNKAKPGKISLRYTTPRLKQSLSLDNVTNVDIRNGPSYIYTTSNDVVWEQQSIDAVGLNYLYIPEGRSAATAMLATDNSFAINKSDLLDVFHTFNLSNNGYVIIEDEIVSFVYKEYKIYKQSDPSIFTTVSVKSDLELASEINKFIKEKQIGLLPSVGIINGATSTDGVTTYTFSNSPTSDVPHPLTSVAVGDFVSITGMNPESLNVSGKVISPVTSNSFKISTKLSSNMTSGWQQGRFTKGLDYDVTIGPTGKITNVNRGMFGTNVSDHKLISNNVTSDVITSKDIKISLLNASNQIVTQSNNFSIVETVTNSDTGTTDSYYYLKLKPNSTGKILAYPNTEVSNNYNTFSGKFYFKEPSTVCSGGIFFNMNTASTNGTYFLELVRYGDKTKENYNYLLILSNIVNGTTTTISYANATALVQTIVSNFERVLRKRSNPTQADGSDAYIPYIDPHESFHLRFTQYDYKHIYDGEGNTPSVADQNLTTPDGKIFSVFLNNFEVTGWQIYSNNQWVNPDKNTITNLRKKVVMPTSLTTGTKFGVFMSNNPTPISGITYGTADNLQNAPIREIYASQKVLKERSVNYYFQDREFLNGLTQGQRLFTNYKEYMMQTQPEIRGINYYDVQYTNGAAVSVDLTRPEYYWIYYPSGGLPDQRWKQIQVVDEYSVSHSTPINTGFRGKFAVVNNTSHVVYLKKDSDEVNNFVGIFNAWTHEIIVPSDPEIIEIVTDPGNLKETMQIDSAFIQSKEAANKLLKIVSGSLDNFSKDINLELFGNPLIEIGDVISLTYPLMGINQQKYIVHSVSHSYNSGLNTKLTLNMLYKGVNT